MAFVNEYISDEDIKRYNLIELMNYYYKLDRRFHPFDPKTRKLRWTIDKERNIWLLKAISMHLPDHREGWTGEVYFVLYYQGRKIEIVLKEEPGTDQSKDPIIKRWTLLRIKEEDIKGFDKKDKQEMFKVLQEALSEYGLDGLTDDDFKEIGFKKDNVQAKLIIEG